MTPPTCPTCAQRHSPLVRCDGTPIDWQARAERARAFTKAWMAAKAGQREGMRYDYTDE